MKGLSLKFDRQLPMLLFFMFVQKKQKWKMDTKNNMDNARFIDEETIPLIQDEYYDEYNTLNTSRVDETSFTELDTNEPTLTLQLRQKVKQDKITTIYRLLNMTCDPSLAHIDQFMIKRIQK